VLWISIDSCFKGSENYLDRSRRGHSERSAAGKGELLIQDMNLRELAVGTEGYSMKWV
jgi:hypothetical protein